MNAQVWVNLWDLGLEFWEPLTLFEIVNEIGIPIKIDMNTLDRKFGLFARVLIDNDLPIDLPSDLAVSRKNGEVMVIEVDYERLSYMCSHCGNVRHNVTACKLVQQTMVTEEKTRRGQLESLDGVAIEQIRFMCPKLI